LPKYRARALGEPVAFVLDLPQFCSVPRGFAVPVYFYTPKRSTKA
jgi:hypothetical protein